jgi:CheY-like chemotaxis protein
MALKRILIVEDSIDVGRLYQEAIRSGYPAAAVTCVPSAEEGILEAARVSFDLLISDIRLPGMSGFDLVRKIRLRQAEIKVIMITGLKIDGDLEKQSKMVGAELLLAKPLSVTGFLSALERVTGEVPQGRAEDVGGTPGKRGRTGNLRRAVLEPKTEPVHPQRSPVHEMKIEPAPPQSGKIAEVEPKPLQRAETAAEMPLLGSALADLRGALDAQAALLLDERGRTVAQAGEWPQNGLEERLAPQVMAALSAMEKVAGVLGPGLLPATHALRGPNFDLAFAPVGRFALLLFLRSTASALRPALAYEQLLNAQSQIGAILEGMGLVLRPGTGIINLLVPEQTETGESGTVSGDEALVEDTARLRTLEALLGESASASHVDADAFWDQAEVKDKPTVPTTGALSYEQAQKLGLVGEEG